MKEIILIQPKAGPYEMLGARLPIGLLSIAAIPYKKGYSIKIIDQRLDNSWQNTLISSLKNDPICVGITCMTGKQIIYAIEAARIVKQYNKNIPVIWGGVHPTLLPEQTLKNPYVDVVVLREGDHTFMELIESIIKKNNFNSIKNIVYKKNGKIIRNKESDFIKDLDSLPELPYSLVDMNSYTCLNIEGKSIDFVTSRGCPFRCSFCYNNYFNKSRWRAFSAEETVRRLKNVVEKYNIKTVYFQDDNFCADINRLKKILEGIIKEKLDIKWGTLGLRIDTAKLMDNDFFSLMQKSGCVNVDIGAESGSERILKMIDKKISVRDMISVNKRISKFPFIVKYTFIIGFPTETKKETLSTVNASLKLVNENKHAYTPYFVFTPFPGTPMYELAKKHGFLPPKSLEEWGKFTADEWYFKFKSWLSPSKIREFNSVAFTSMFANSNIRYKINKASTRFLFDVYHPIAKLRFKNNFHFLPIDSLISKKILMNQL